MVRGRCPPRDRFPRPGVLWLESSGVQGFWLFPASPLPDAVTEADERYQRAGEKGRTPTLLRTIPYTTPDDPPRRRANKVKGHGTGNTDRPPIAGVVGRESGQVRLRVGAHSDRQTLQPFVETQTAEGCTVNTGEWQAYNHLPEHGRTHKQSVISLVNGNGHGTLKAARRAEGPDRSLPKSWGGGEESQIKSLHAQPTKCCCLPTQSRSAWYQSPDLASSSCRR